MFIELRKLCEQENLTVAITPKRMNVKETFFAKRQRKCDEIFAIYIDFMKERSKEAFCVKIITFCLLYRECLNQSASALEQGKKNLPQSVLFQEKISKESEYCLQNNAEQMPDIANDFIARFLHTWKGTIDINEMKELTFHFCNWIFFNSYTCSLIHLNPNPFDDVIKEIKMKNSFDCNEAKQQIKVVIKSGNNEDAKESNKEFIEREMVENKEESEEVLGKVLEKQRKKTITRKTGNN